MTLEVSYYLEKFFKMVVFNYLFSNGDAHLKNFALLETANGDYILSPAYDLINTKIHVDDSAFALNKGLFKDKFQSKEKKKNGRVGLGDFLEFAKRIGIKDSRVDALLNPFLERQVLAESLISRSFLNDQTKRGYKMNYEARRNQLSRK
jgi:serine/threonine-protein kinase HipA